MEKQVNSAINESGIDIYWVYKKLTQYCVYFPLVGFFGSTYILGIFFLEILIIGDLQNVYLFRLVTYPALFFSNNLNKREYDYRDMVGVVWFWIFVFGLISIPVRKFAKKSQVLSRIKGYNIAFISYALLYLVTMILSVHLKHNFGPLLIFLLIFLFSLGVGALWLARYVDSNLLGKKSNV